MESRILSRVDKASLRPVDSRRINFNSPSQETVDIVRQNSLSFSATELLDFTPEEIILLSKRIRLLFTRIASQNKLRIEKKDLEEFKDNDENSLLHELDHLRKSRELRPDIVTEANVNILPIVHNGTLKVAMNITVPAPDLAFTVTEKTLILMAPNLPSGQDYLDLLRFMESHTLTKEDIGGVLEIVMRKKPSHGKDHFLASLAKLSDA